MGRLNLADLIRERLLEGGVPFGVSWWYVQGVHSCIYETFPFVFTYISILRLFLHVQGILFPRQS